MLKDAHEFFQFVMGIFPDGGAMSNGINPVKLSRHPNPFCGLCLT